MSAGQRIPEPGPRAVFRPQGTCPRQWIAAVGTDLLRDARGAVRRFATEGKALHAAQIAAQRSVA